MSMSSNRPTTPNSTPADNAREVALEVLPVEVEPTWRAKAASENSPAALNDLWAGS